MFPLGVYIHLPFCLSKCPYCSFNSYVVSPLPENDYINALLSEMRLISRQGFSEHRVVDTVYFGGGTPSLFSPHSVEKMLDAVSAYYTFSDEVEITLEANPGSLDIRKLKRFFKCGVNRLSIGVQSLQNGLLYTLGRIHSAQDAYEVFYSAREVGFRNVGIDVLFGIPTQTLYALQEDLERLTALAPEHIAAYNFTVESDTAFFRWVREGRYTPLSEEEEVEMHSLVHGTLVDAGYDHYEISNFALPGYHSRHNQKYWMVKPYMGLGAGAHSYKCISDAEGMRWWNISDPSCYMRAIENGQSGIAGRERLGEGEARGEALFLGLRQLKGINLFDFEKNFNISLDRAYPGVVSHLIAAGLLELTTDHLRLTSRGVLLSNEVFYHFF